MKGTTRWSSKLLSLRTSRPWVADSLKTKDQGRTRSVIKSKDSSVLRRKSFASPFYRLLCNAVQNRVEKFLSYATWTRKRDASDSREIVFIREEFGNNLARELNASRLARNLRFRVKVQKLKVNRDVSLSSYGTCVPLAIYQLKFKVLVKRVYQYYDKLCYVENCVLKYKKCCHSTVLILKRPFARSLRVKIFRTCLCLLFCNIGKRKGENKVEASSHVCCNIS